LQSQCPRGIADVLFSRQKPIAWHREVSIFAEVRIVVLIACLQNYSSI
jgi:hypothetical protein